VSNLSPIARQTLTYQKIGDALVKLNYPLGGFLDGISIWSPRRQGDFGGEATSIIGEAITVKMVDATDTTSPKTPIHFADANESGKIMYIQQPRGLKSACFGGLMAARSKYLGASGVVIDGRFRDIQEIQELDLPVRLPFPTLFFTCSWQCTILLRITDCWLWWSQLFARGNSILGSNTFTRASELNVKLQFQDSDLWIHPGDIIVGDHDGVVIVPPSLVEKVVEICADRKEVDAKTMEALKNGAGMAESLKKFRK
jgi:regulator of RNase E activity RraA